MPSIRSGGRVGGGVVFSILTARSLFFSVSEELFFYSHWRTGREEKRIRFDPKTLAITESTCSSSSSRLDVKKGRRRYTQTTQHLDVSVVIIDTTKDWEIMLVVAGGSCSTPMLNS